MKWPPGRMSDEGSLRVLAALAVIIGVALRLREFLQVRSLRTEEAALALRLIDSSVIELFRMDAGSLHTAPVGFMLLEKLNIGWFGDSELALRMVPLLAGCAVLLLTFPIMRRFVEARAAVLVVWFAALSPHLIFFSNEVKQYSTDVLINLLLLLAAHRTLHRGRPTDWVIFAAGGAVAVWFSHPAALMLASAGLVFLFLSALRRDRTTAGAAVLTATAWVASLAVSHSFLTATQMGSSRIQGSWSNRFLPFPPTNPDDLRWYYDSFGGFFDHPVGFEAVWLAAFAFFVGGIGLWRRQSRANLALLTGPILVTLAVSALGVYPFYQRLLLFLVPGVFAVIAVGVFEIGRHHRPAGVFMAAFLMVGPTKTVAVPPIAPIPLQEVRAVLERVEESRQPGDRIMVQAGSMTQFEYYFRRGIVDVPADVILPPWSFEGRPRVLLLRQSLRALAPGDRVWLVASSRPAGVSTAYLRELNRHGLVQNRFVATNAIAVLFTMNSPVRQEAP